MGILKKRGSYRLQSCNSREPQDENDSGFNDELQTSQTSLTYETAPKTSLLNPKCFQHLTRKMSTILTVGVLSCSIASSSASNFHFTNRGSHYNIARGGYGTASSKLSQINSIKRVASSEVNQVLENRFYNCEQEYTSEGQLSNSESVSFTSNTARATADALAGAFIEELPRYSSKQIEDENPTIHNEEYDWIDDPTEGPGDLESPELNYSQPDELEDPEYAPESMAGAGNGLKRQAQDLYEKFRHRRSGDLDEYPEHERTGAHRIDSDDEEERFSSGILIRKKRDTEKPAQVAEQQEDPIVYRYFGRSSARSRKDHIPFIVLSPRVDYWKAAGTILASKGFSVMACETSRSSVSSAIKGRDQGTIDAANKGERMVSTALDALRWKRAVIVGNDSGGVAALEAALRLGPERVAGLVLCGDLTQVNEYVKSLLPSTPSISNLQSNVVRKPALDEFLDNFLPCPSIIVWDGDLHTLPTYHKGSNLKLPDYKLRELHRQIILGGGSSPHRRLPEQFSWVLSRFVEKHFANPTSIAADAPNKVSQTHKIARGGSAASTNSILGMTFIDRFFPQESMTVVGRLLAAGIIYMTAANVLLFQYHNLCCVLTAVRSNITSLSVLQRRGWTLISGIISSDWQRSNSFIRRMMLSARLPRRRRRIDVDSALEQTIQEQYPKVDEVPEAKIVPVPEEMAPNEPPLKAVPRWDNWSLGCVTA